VGNKQIDQKANSNEEAAMRLGTIDTDKWKLRRWCLKIGSKLGQSEG